MVVSLDIEGRRFTNFMETFRMAFESLDTQLIGTPTLDCAEYGKGHTVTAWFETANGKYGIEFGRYFAYDENMEHCITYTYNENEQRYQMNNNNEYSNNNREVVVSVNQLVNALKIIKQ